MNSIRKYYALAAALVAFAVPASLLAKANVGQPAPDFTLTDLDGKEHQLSAYRGRTVVLEWVNPECPFVVRHYESKNMPQLQRSAAGEDVVWLTINSAAKGEQGDYAPDRAREWKKKHGAAPAAYLRDSEGKVGRQYGAKTTPHMFVIDPQGRLAYDGAIDNSPRGRGDVENYVTAALAAVKTGATPAKAKTDPYGCPVKY